MGICCAMISNLRYKITLVRWLMLRMSLDRNTYSLQYGDLSACNTISHNRRNQTMLIDLDLSST